MNTVEFEKLILAAAGGDTIKLFDITLESQNPCILTYTPSPGFRVNSVKWNHNNLVLASAGEDSKISLWRKNGQSLWTVPAKNASREIVEPSESISTISFSNKGSRYLCSGGTGQVVQIWDLQNKRCVKRLKGHTDTITGVIYNCKDEHIASVSRKGDLILHNLASGTRAAEMRDPNGQVLSALDYSRMSRHLLLTAGDDGSIHLWDTTGRSPKVSWLKQHSAPTSGVSFSPSNDKIFASVGLDMKLYTFDSNSRKPTSCIHYEAPFSSLAFTDDGLTLAAGTSTGQVVFYDTRGKAQPVKVLRAYGNSEAVTNLCWQRSKPVIVNEVTCTSETVLLAGDAGDSILMPDPLPSRAPSNFTMTPAVSGSRNSSRSSLSGDLFSFATDNSGSVSSGLTLSASEEIRQKSSLLSGGTPARLLAPRNYNFKDDMEVFSPVVDVQPLRPSLDKFWDDNDGLKKNLDKKPSFLFHSRRFGFSEEGSSDSHSIFDRKASLSSKQDDIHSTFSQLTSTPVSMHPNYSSSITPTDAWGGEIVSDKYSHHQSTNIPSRFALLTSTSLSSVFTPSDSLPPTQSTSSLTSGLSLTNFHIRETSQDASFASAEAVSSPLGRKGSTAQSHDSLGPAFSLPRKFSSYAERIGATASFGDPSSFSVDSPKFKKTGAETREELFNNVLSRSEILSSAGAGVPTSTNGEMAQLQKISSLQSESQQGTSFTLQLFQRTLDETLETFRKSIHEDMRNLHIEILRQFHMQEMEMTSIMGLILENQAEIRKELQSIRKETQQIHQLL